MDMNPKLPRFDVVIEIPRGSFLKRGWDGNIDFISPVPCPFNYGAIHDYVGCDGDLLDAVVLGQRMSRGTTVNVIAHEAIGLTDRGMYDDKLICSAGMLKACKKRSILLFFHFYALSKRMLNFYRGRSGGTYCNGWVGVSSAIARATPREDTNWNGPSIPF